MSPFENDLLWTEDYRLAQPYSINDDEVMRLLVPIVKWTILYRDKIKDYLDRETYTNSDDYVFEINFIDSVVRRIITLRKILIEIIIKSNMEQGVSIENTYMVPMYAVLLEMFDEDLENTVIELLYERFDRRKYDCRSVSKWITYISVTKGDKTNNISIEEYIRLHGSLRPDKHMSKFFDDKINSMSDDDITRTREFIVELINGHVDEDIMQKLKTLEIEKCLIEEINY